MDATEEPTPVPDLRRRSQSSSRQAVHAHDGLGPWKAMGVVLSVIIGAGTVAGVVTRSLYVPREEYTQKVVNDAVSSSQLTSAINDLRTSYAEQRRTLDAMTIDINVVKTDLAIIKRRSR